MICLLQIVETMSYTDNVATFLNSLDSFYENVPAEDLELLIGPIIDRVRSRPDSPLSGSPLGNYCLQMFTTHVLLSCQNYFKSVPYCKLVNSGSWYLWTNPCIRWFEPFSTPLWPPTDQICSLLLNIICKAQMLMLCSIVSNKYNSLGRN